ncbi:MAG: GntR family transcriptional regulator [Burkholderiaceae bacterium]
MSGESLSLNSRGPLYRAARENLLRDLALGRYSPGARLPAERELSAQYGISIGTLRKAVDELVAEGLLVRRQGSGTFVASHDRERLRYAFFHMVPHDGEKTGYPVPELQSFARGRLDATAADKLQQPVGAPCWNIRNRLALDGTAVMIDDIWLASARFPRLSASVVRNRPSTLYNLYESSFGLTVARTSERLRASAAPAAIARLLGVPSGAPVLVIRRVAYGYRHDPIEWRISHANTAAHEYFSELA